MKTMIVSLFILFPIMGSAEWTVDFSRRHKDMQRLELEKQAAKAAKKSTVAQVFEKEMPREEVVIVNSENGFTPKVLRLKKGQLYKVSVVNVNKKKKNVSFMLDAFSEHHGTFFGDVVEFDLKPVKEGLFPFFCPETEIVGKVLVYGETEQLEPLPAIQIRQPASSGSERAHNWVRGGNG